MKMLLKILLLSLTVTACGQIKNARYKSIIDHASRVEINYKDSNTRIDLDKNQVEIFKEILKNNITPEAQMKFDADIQIKLYNNEKRLGFLMLTENSTRPFVNFESDDLNFGFRLTYGIGQYLGEARSNL